MLLDGFEHFELCPAALKIVALADLFQDRIDICRHELKNLGIEVSDSRCFTGFDAYKKAMDCLKPGDVAIFTTPLAFRWVHFGYAIDKGLNVFMEKPLTADGPTTRKMIALAEEADKKNLKVGVGLMVRHCRGRQELHERIKGGQIGELMLLRAYRMAGASCTAAPEQRSQAAEPCRRAVLP